MKITVNQKNLRRALGLVERVISKSISLPILNNIIIKTDQGRVRISATNLEIGISVLIGAKTDEVGEIAVPGRILSDLISATSEDVLTLTTKNNTLFITGKRVKTQILGFDTKDYPLIPKITNDPVCEIPAQALKNAYATVFDSIAISETRPELAGLYMQFQSKSLVCVATDSFRLAEHRIDVKNSQTLNVIVPKMTVLEIMRVTSDLDEPVVVRVGENQISFLSQDVEVISRLIDGKYPDYTKIIPEKYVSRVLVEKNELEQAIRLAGLFSSSISDIKLECDKENLTLLSSNADRGEAQTTVPVVLKNEPFSVTLNFHYLLDGIKIIPTEKMVIEFTGDSSPLVLRPANDEIKVVYLIMPLRN